MACPPCFSKSSRKPPVYHPSTSQPANTALGRYHAWWVFESMRYSSSWQLGRHGDRRDSISLRCQILDSLKKAVWLALPLLRSMRKSSSLDFKGIRLVEKKGCFKSADDNHPPPRLHDSPSTQVSKVRPYLPNPSGTQGQYGVDE